MSNKRTCSIDGCEKPCHGRGYCNKHYRRLLAHGDALGGRFEHEALLTWLRNAVETAVNGDECLLGWPYTTGAGYPYVTYEGKQQLACRVILMLSGIEPTPEKNHCCHSCDNPLCLNKFHLRFGTIQDNTTDMINHNRQAKGENHGQAKLTESQVVAIRKQKANGQTHRDIALQFHICTASVSRIVNRKQWTHVV